MKIGNRFQENPNNSYDRGFSDGIRLAKEIVKKYRWLDDNTDIILDELDEVR